MVHFQILDVHSQDRTITNETSNEKEVVYEPNDDEDTHKSKSYHKKEIVIHLFGTTSEGQSLRVTLTGFQPYFYVELPDAKNKTYSYFLDLLKHRVNDDVSFNKMLYDSIEKTFVKKEKLYGYTKKTLFPFVKLSVPSLQYFYTLKKLFLDEKNNPIFKLNETEEPLDVYEANLDPMLRFFHVRGLQPCGWATIDCDYELNIEIDWNDISPHTSSLAVAPYKIGFWDIECYSASGDFPLPKKDYSKIAKQLYSTTNTYEEVYDLLIRSIQDPMEPPRNIDGFFLKKPIPSIDRLEAILCEKRFKADIEDVFQHRLGEEKLSLILTKHLAKSLPIAGDPVIQIGIVLSDENHIFVLGTCDDVEGIYVHSYLSEKDMIVGFLKFLIEKNPDILIGYNVFGFDQKYLYERMEELNLTNIEAFQKLSRLEDITEYSDTKPLVSLQKKLLSSSALGDNTLYIWNTTGRLHIDLYFYIKRIENLTSYKLDDVCRHYMSGKLKSIVQSKDTWFIETKETNDAVGKYVVFLDELGDTIIEKRKVLEITPKGFIIEAPLVFDDLDLQTIALWAIVKDDVSPAEIFRFHEKGSKERAIIAKYCIQDCVLVKDLFVKLDVFNNAMAMANTCSVPVGFIFTRGQGIKCESLIFKECASRNQLINVLPSPTNDVEESYEGAIVLDPEPNFYADSPIGVADFASLYPSTIYSENISYDSLLWAKDYVKNIEKYSFGSIESEKYLDPSVAFTDIEFDIWAPDPNDTRKSPTKIKLGTRVCRYVQQADDRKGTLPDIISKLLSARKSKRKEAEKENDPFKKALLDAEQLAYKLTANSLYGQLGSSTFKVRLQHLAASTTAYGRKQILFAKDAIEMFYGKGANDPRCHVNVIYGDTDSLFINFNVMNPKTKEKLFGKEAIEATMALTEEAGKFVTRCLKKPHDFEYDKVFYPFIIFSKKRYVGNKFEGDPTAYKQTSMGIATKRRDYAGIVKNVYGGAIKILLNEKDILKAFTFVQRVCNDLVDGKISEHQLILTKSLRSEYKAVTPPAHKILAQRITLRDPGNAPTSGERMQFMYILPEAGQAASKLQGDRIETPSYIKENKLKVDFKYYIEHQIFNPISQLFGLFVEQLPGYVKPSNTMCTEEKEVYAGELIFRSIYNKCDNQVVRNFAKKFGFQVEEKVDKVDKVDKVPLIRSKMKSTKNMEVNFQKIDRYLIKEYDEKKKKKISEQS